MRNTHKGRAAPITFTDDAIIRALWNGQKTQMRIIASHDGQLPPRWATFAQELSHPSIRGDTVPSNVFRWSEEQAPDRLKILRRWPGLSKDLVHDWIAIRCPIAHRRGMLLWVKEPHQDVHPLQVSDGISHLRGRHCQKGQAGIPGPPGVTYETIYRADGPYLPLHHDHQDGTDVRGWPYRARCPGADCKLPHHKYTESGYTGWTQARMMQSWASRMFLEITDIRIQRLQQMTAIDARSEGMPSTMPIPLDVYRKHWDERHQGREKWNANPWVFVIDFRVWQANIDKHVERLERGEKPHYFAPRGNNPPLA